MTLVRLSEGLGYVTGVLASPAFALGSLLRRARIFHPDGQIFSAVCEPEASAPALAAVAERLAGTAVVRLSAGLWRRGREWPDVLGCAIRLRGRRPAAATAEPGDQDLLFASFRSLVTLPLAFVATNQHDYLRNTYYAVLPYELAGVGAVSLRLVPTTPVEGRGVNREARLGDALRRGPVTFRLELRPRFRLLSAWRPLASLRLVEPLGVPPQALRFSPWRDGMGLRPRGFVQAARALPYRFSQRARALVEA